MGGKGDMKNCLIINGGYIELYAQDDCLDANGNLVINGGTIKATKPNGTFTGAFGIVDPDGKVTISEKANLVFAAGSGSVRNLGLRQNTITVYCENNHEANEKISVVDASGNITYEYIPGGSYKAILIASENIKIGEKYTITTGNESFEAEISEQNTVVGTLGDGGVDFGRGPQMW